MSTGTAIFLILIGPVAAVMGVASRWWIGRREERPRPSHALTPREQLRWGQHRVMQYMGVPLGLGLFVLGITGLLQGPS